MGLLIKEVVLTTVLCVMLLQPQPTMAQSADEYEYERSSLCMMLVQHPAKHFGNEIQYVFLKMPVPNRFYSHDLGVRLVSFAEQNRAPEKNFESFIRQVSLGRRLVAKWFDRNKKTGSMDMELIRRRGLYNASKSATNAARGQLRGSALLEDAGELLLSNTYVVFSDIQYVDKSVGWGIFKDVINSVANFAEILVLNTSTYDDDNPFENPAFSSINANIDDIKGFKVKISSYLYKLKWNNETSAAFYDRFYVDSLNPDKNKVIAFNNDKNSFPMEYVGMVESTQSNTTLKGTTTNEELITKVCTRAVDKNLAELQHKFPEFRIKAPLISVEPLQAYIGLREDITENTKFEVLERNVDDEGHVEYKRVGIIKPEKGMIWDNRYWAAEEETENSSLEATTFKKVSGGDFYPGMLIRELE